MTKGLESAKTHFVVIFGVHFVSELKKYSWMVNFLNSQLINTDSDIKCAVFVPEFSCSTGGGVL